MSDIRRTDVFQHAIRTLAHPFSLLSMAVLFFNDYYLRIAHPSWLTGKLGDFAWLFFFPIFLTALLVWVLPKKWLMGTTPILIGIGITALAFTLGKTVPVILSVISNSIEFFMPWQVGWVIDPTDLIALPTMALTLLLWVKLPEPRPVRHPQLKWLWLGGALLLTMGNSGIPPTGIAFLEIIDGDIYATEAFGVYKSSNGGFDWETVSTDTDWIEKEAIEIVINPENELDQYRVVDEQVIQHTVDGGKTWNDEFQLKPKTEAELAHFAAHHNRFNDGVPLDAVFDPATDNLVLAMGFDGVLIREPNGEYSWVAVADFHREEYSFDGLLFLLYPAEVFLALFLASACVGSFLFPTMKTFQKVLLIIAGIGTLIYSFVYQPARRYLDIVNTDITDFLPFFWLILWIMLFLFSIYLLVLIFSRMRPVLPMILAFVVIPIVHLGIMILWGYNIIPWYLLALGISLALNIGWTVYWHLQNAKLRKQLAGQQATPPAPPATPPPPPASDH